MKVLFEGLEYRYKPEIYSPKIESLEIYKREEVNGKRCYYFPDDEDRYYSVSTICKELLPWQFKNRKFTDTTAMDRGTTIHKFMESVVKQEARPKVCVEDAIHCRNLYNYSQNNFEEIYLSEAVVRSKKHPLIKYAGMVDVVCLHKGELTLVDYKIGNKNTLFNKDMLPVYFAQLYGYSNALIESGVNISKVMLLRSMPREGGIQVVTKPLEDIETYFNRAVRIFNEEVN